MRGCLKVAKVGVGCAVRRARSRSALARGGSAAATATSSSATARFWPVLTALLIIDAAATEAIARNADHDAERDRPLSADSAALASGALAPRVAEGEAGVADLPETHRLAESLGVGSRGVRGQDRGVEARVSDLIGADALAGRRDAGTRSAGGIAHRLGSVRGVGDAMPPCVALP